MGYFENKNGSPQQKFFIPLSGYAKKLDQHVQTRYLENIAAIGTHLVLIEGKRFEQDCLPPVESTDVLLYLVLDTSFYTHQQLEAFRSLEVYNHMLPGWIASVKGYFVSNKFIVPGKACVIDTLIPVWIITEKEGSIIFAHCVDSKASLSETSSTLQVHSYL